MTTLKSIRTIKSIKHQLGIVLLMSLATLQIANAQIEVDTKYYHKTKAIMNITHNI